ncbi:MAG: LysR family transcriptional regulator [Myxococcota bacterium]
MQIREEPRWDDLRVLLALSRHGSLKRSAEALGVNISTVSRRLDALEASTGAHLFDRTPAGVHATAAAEQLLPFAEAMESAAAGLAHGLGALETEPEGDVCITAPPGLVDQFLAPALPRLTRDHPGLRITIVSSIAYADLTRREADIALRISRPISGDLVTKRLATQPWCVLAAKRGPTAVLRDPNAARWVTWGEELAHLPDRQWIDANVRREQVVLTTNSMTAQLETIRAGLGYTLAPQVFAQTRGLRAVPCTPKLRQSLAAVPQGSLWLVGHRALRDVPRVAAVWDWLCRELELVTRREA